MPPLFIIFILFFHVFNVECSVNTNASTNDVDDTLIIVTLSAVKDGRNSKEFRIHWNHPNFIEGDNLALYEGDPTIDKDVPVIFSKLLGHTNGVVRTGIYVPEYAINSYYAAIVHEGRIKKVSNISPKPRWMEKRRSSLGKLSIPQLLIPGTHGSGNYVRPSDTIFNVKFHTLKWAQTQDYSIKQQLEYGIRYLDIRPTWDRKKNTYNVNHAGVVMIPMSDVINEIDEFLNQTKEIVILSFKEFPQGFLDTKDHEQFSLYIERGLSRHIQPYDLNRGWRLPLNHFWNSNRRLLVSYSHSYRRSIFWPPIPQYWGDCRTIDCLRSFLQSVHDASPGYSLQSTAAMAELTHNTTTGIRDSLSLSRKSTLRKWADEVGLLIPKWYSEDWNSTANIVAVDYFLSSGIVDLAINLNEKRAKTFSNHH